MKSLLILVVLFLSTSTFAQSDTRYIGYSFTPTLYESSSIIAFGHKIEGGLEYRSGWNLLGGLQYNFNRSQHSFSNYSYRSQGLSGSISLLRRLTKSYGIISPIGGVCLGGSFLNSERKNPNGDLTAIKSAYSTQEFSPRFFATLMLQLDLAIGPFALRGGPSYTIQEFRTSENDRMQSTLSRAIGFRFGFFYILNNTQTLRKVHIPSKGLIKNKYR